MPRRRKDESEFSSLPPPPPPATTERGREDQLTNLAYNLVEQRFLDGTASPAETTHFLKVGSSRQKEEIEKLRAEKDVLHARIKEMENRTSGEQLLSEALAAFRGYSGQGPIQDEEDVYLPDADY